MLKLELIELPWHPKTNNAGASVKSGFELGSMLFSIVGPQVKVEIGLEVEDVTCAHKISCWMGHK
jgi:hypothetical protein